MQPKNDVQAVRQIGTLGQNVENTLLKAITTFLLTRNGSGNIRIKIQLSNTQGVINWSVCLTMLPK